MTFISWFASRNPADAVLPVTEKPPVLMGILVERGSCVLVGSEDTRRGVKLVTVPADLLARYNIARQLYDCVQNELKALPQSLQPRRRKSVSTEPDNG